MVASSCHWLVLGISPQLETIHNLGAPLKHVSACYGSAPPPGQSKRLYPPNIGYCPSTTGTLTKITNKLPNFTIHKNKTFFVLTNI